MSAPLLKSCAEMGETHGELSLPQTLSNSASFWRRINRPVGVFTRVSGSSNKGCHCVSAGEESACSAGDLGLIPGLGRSPLEGNSYPLQYSGLENSTDCIIHGVAKSQT